MRGGQGERQRERERGSGEEEELGNTGRDVRGEKERDRGRRTLGER